MTELGLLRSIGAEGGPTDEQVEHARGHAHERLRAAIAREQARPERRSGFRGAIPARRAVLAGAAAALALVVAAGVAFTALRPPAATARLDRLAVAAERAQQPTAGIADVEYTVSHVTDLVQQAVAGGDVVTFLTEQRVERWASADGTLRIRREFGEPRFLRPEDEAAFRAAGLAATYGAGVITDDVFEEAPAGSLLIGDWSTDPTELRAQMEGDLDRATSDLPRPARMLQLGASLMQAPRSTPELRAALLRVLADVDGIATEGATTPGGRPGVAASVDYDSGGIAYTERFVFDEATADLVAQSLTARDELPGGIPAGTVLRSRVNEPAIAVPSLEATTG